MNKNGLYSVGRVTALTGLTARTLHHYDEIGLLKPSVVADSGYRYYDDSALVKLSQIMLLRELDFPLSEIAALLEEGSAERRSTLEKQREILELKRDRLSRIIDIISAMEEGAECSIDMSVFDTAEIENAKREYEEEVLSRWSDTSAYEESMQNEAQRTSDQWKKISDEADEIFRAFAACRGCDPASIQVQHLVARWQEHISKYYYACDKVILASLGQMYSNDERFTANIDRRGTGTAALMSRAIEIYCA